MLDIDAEHVRNQAADKGEFCFALAKDGFDAFADAFAICFEVREQFLAGDEAGAMLLG